MAPARPASSGLGAGRKPSSGRPLFFGSSARHSSRVEKRTAPASEGTRRRKREKSLASTAVDPEENARLTLVRPEPESSTVQSSPKLNGRAHRKERSLPRINNNTSLATGGGIVGNDEEPESRRPVVCHDSSQGGPELKSLADLLLVLDRRRNFRIPSNKIIASKDVDNRVYQQMRRLAPGGELTPDHVRNNLIDSIGDFEPRWHLRTKKSRAFFWNRVCKNESTSWMRRLDGADCREFFLWLVTYFRHGSGDKTKKTTSELIKSFERLRELFQEEEDCELDELVGIEARIQLPAVRPAGHDRAAVSKEQGSMSKPVAGNIFRLSGNTNMTDDELRGVDIQGLTPIVDVGDSRRKNEDRQKAFNEELEADKARIAEEQAQLP